MLTIEELKQTKHMLMIARNDYEYTEFKLRDMGKEDRARFANEICYGFQQSGEKFLKSFLWSKGKKPLRTHDTSALFEACLDFDATLEDIRESCLVLQAYVVSARYPESEEHFMMKKMCPSPLMQPKRSCKECCQLLKTTSPRASVRNDRPPGDDIQSFPRVACLA